MRRPLTYLQKRVQRRPRQADMDGVYLGYDGTEFHELADHVEDSVADIAQHDDLAVSPCVFPAALDALLSLGLHQGKDVFQDKSLVRLVKVDEMRALSAQDAHGVEPQV